MVKIIAAFLLASGLVSLVVGLKDKKNGSLPLMSFNAIVDVLLGLILFMFPGFVAGLLIYLIGFILIVFGAMQLISLLSANRVMKVGVWSFLFPALVLASGVFLVFNPSFVGEAIGIVAGAALIVYGASELLSSWKMKKAMDEYGNADMPPMDNVKDVDYEKVDEQ